MPMPDSTVDAIFDALRRNGGKWRGQLQGRLCSVQRTYRGRRSLRRVGPVVIYLKGAVGTRAVWIRRQEAVSGSLGKAIDSLRKAEVRRAEAQGRPDIEYSAHDFGWIEARMQDQAAWSRVLALMNTDVGQSVTKITVSPNGVILNLAWPPPARVAREEVRRWLEELLALLEQLEAAPPQEILKPNRAEMASEDPKQAFLLGCMGFVLVLGAILLITGCILAVLFSLIFAMKGFKL